jgi:predicted ATP-dependent endonuclease of OLD family
MYLSRLFIENFRSIKKIDLSFGDGKNVIIGRNNAGKSNIVRALDLVLGEGSPTYARSENVTIDDFYTWRDSDADDAPVHISNDLVIWCELTRSDDEDLNYDDLYKCFGFKVHASDVRWEGTAGKKKAIITPERFPATNVPDQIRSIFEINEDDAKTGYVNPKLRNQKTYEDEFEPCTCFAYVFYARHSENGRIEKLIRFLYREDDQHDWMLAFSASIRTELLQSAIIPSFRDPQSQLRLSSWTWFGKLMRHLVGKHEDSDDLKAALNQVREVSKTIFQEVQAEIDQSALSVAFPGTRLSIQLAADTKSNLYKNSVLYLDDGFRSPLVDKGAGIQSATIIGLFNFYTHHVNTTASALLCIEEPELYLHPHARRVVSDRLDQFLERGRHQVILTTHSTEFVRTTRPDVRILRMHRNGGDSVCQTVTLKELRQLILNPNQNEVLFADKAIICEGYDEYALRFVADEFFRGELDSNNVSIVAVGGKDQFRQCVEFTLKLGIKPYILADFDFFLRDKGEERKKYGAEAHESLQSLGPRFFQMPHICGDEGQNVYNHIQSLRAELKRDEEESFYKAKHVSEFKNERVSKAITFLRQNGVCILDGEIELLFQRYVSGKLSLDKVYDLNRRIIEGENPSTFMETDVIRDFVSKVLSD